MAAALCAGPAAAKDVTIERVLVCEVPDACHDTVCLGSDTPLYVMFARVASGGEAVVLVTPMGMLAAGSSDPEDADQRFFRVKQDPSGMPIRSMSLLSDGGILLSLWVNRDMSATLGGTCIEQDPQEAGL